MYEKAPAYRIKGPEHGLLLRLAGRFDPQIDAAPRPAARQIGMRKRLGFVEEHQIDRPCCRLGFQIGEVLTAGLDRHCVLAPFESMARPPPGNPLWRNWCDSPRGEIAGPRGGAISAHSRGSVQPPSWRVSSSRIAAAIAPACGPILACCPGLGRCRSPATPPCAKYPRQLRTVLMCTPELRQSPRPSAPPALARSPALGPLRRVAPTSTGRARWPVPQYQP